MKQIQYKRYALELASILTLQGLTMGLFSTDVYATEWGNQPSHHAHDRRPPTHKAADQDAVRQFTQFTNNLEAGRFALDETPFSFVGEAPGQAIVPNRQTGFAIGVAYWFGVYLGCAAVHIDQTATECRDEVLGGTAEAVGELAGSFIRDADRFINKMADAIEKTVNETIPQDPQTALLLTSFQLNGVDVHGQLIARATSPDNVVFRKQLTNFLGGGTFIGSKAFGGRVLDSTGKPIPNAVVRIGVFIKNDGTMLLVPITFFARLVDIVNANTIEWDLEPVVSTGILKTTGLRVFAVETGASVDPATPSN